MTTPTVDYGNTENQPDLLRQDASWYVDGDNHSWAATVYHNKNLIHIYADGEMKILFGDKRLRVAGDLWRNDITTDKQLFELSESGSIEWVNNAWFDLYDGESGDHLDAVCHSIDDAVGQAQVLLLDQTYYPTSDESGEPRT